MGLTLLSPPRVVGKRIRCVMCLVQVCPRGHPTPQSWSYHCPYFCFQGKTWSLPQPIFLPMFIPGSTGFSPRSLSDKAEAPSHLLQSCQWQALARGLGLLHILIPHSCLPFPPCCFIICLVKFWLDSKTGSDLAGSKALLERKMSVNSWDKKLSGGRELE